MAEFNKVPLPFNPAVSPTDAPNYLGMSRAIDTPDADKKYGSLFQGIGNLLDVGVGGLDFLLKERIKNSLYNKIDVERDQHGVGDATEAAVERGNPLDTIGSKEAIDATLKDRLVLDPDSEYNKALIDPNATESAKKPPETVQAEINRAGTFLNRLNDARESGKLTNTAYSARLEAIVRDTRARFPGYREYIDQEVSKITGMVPANALRQNIQNDIDAAAVSRQSEQDKLITLAIAHAADLGLAFNPTVDDIRNKRIDRLGLMQRIQPYLAGKQKINDAILEMNLGEKANTLDKHTITAKATDITNQIVSNRLENITQAYGGMTAVMKRLEQAQLAKAGLPGGVPMNDEDAGKLSQLFQLEYTRTEAEVRAQVYKVDPVSGKSVANRLGGNKEAEEHIANTMKRFSSVSDAIRNKDWGMASYNANAIKAITADDKLTLINRDADFRAINTLSTFGPQILPHLFKDKMDTLSNVTKTVTKYAQAQIASQTQAAKRGFPFTGNEALDVLEQAAPKNSEGKPVPHAPLAYETLVKTFDGIGDKTLPFKYRENLALGAFTPENRGFVGKFEPRDRLNVFLQMTNPKTAEGMKDIIAANPALGQEFKNWVEGSFGNDVFRQKIQDLQGIVGTNQYVISWQDKTNQLVVFPNPNAPKQQPTALISQPTIDRATAEEQAKVKRTVEEINTGLRNVDTVAGLFNEKEKVGPYLYNLLKSMGYNPAQVLDPLADIGTHITAAIEAQSKAKQMEEDAMKGINPVQKRQRK